MTRPPLWILLFLCATALLLTGRAQVPQIISYQGRVVSGGKNFSGSGGFKFALVNGTGNVTYWSNDGSSTAGSQPVSPVSLTVSGGLFTVGLGDSINFGNMTPVPASVFSNSDVRLRIWFSDGANPYEQLTPDQRLAAVGYAVVAATAQTVAAGAIGNAQLAPAAVQSTNIATGAVGSAQLASGAITNAQLGSGAVQSGNIGPGAVGPTQLAAGAVTNTQLAANAVQSANIASGAVGSTQLATGAVTNGQLAANAVQSGNIASGAVGATQLAAGAVAGGNIASGTVTIQNLVTRTVGTSVGAGGIAQSDIIGVGTSNTTPTPVGSITLTCTGRPVWLGLMASGEGAGASSAIAISSNSANGDYLGFFALFRDNTQIALPILRTHGTGGATYNACPPGAVNFLDTGANAGPHTYELRIYSSTSSASVTAQSVRLTAFEF